jgi:acylphosphatase
MAANTPDKNPELEPAAAAASPDDHQRAEVRVSGFVQGVYYRSAATEQARVLGLRGVVRNLPDGEVELIAEGPLPALQQLIAWCHLGPPAARVDSVAVDFSLPTYEYTDFRVLRQGTAAITEGGTGDFPTVVTGRSSGSGS